MVADIFINSTRIAPGERATVDLPMARLYTHTPMSMPVHVVNGRQDGPRLFVCAALHGDELNGVEVIRRLLRLKGITRIQGALIAVPIVNVYGIVNHSRYLPDRRDLNRAFPGSERGSMTARLANLFVQEILSNATHGIDIHTGALHRDNLPHVRAKLDDAETVRLARAFGAPVIMNTDLHDGSLRQVATERNIPILVYEAGEALRFDEMCIRAGVRGIVEVMRSLGMLPAGKRPRRPPKPAEAYASSWVRASVSGILRAITPLGARVAKGEVMGIIADPFGEEEILVTAPVGGVVIARLNLPLVNEGDALFHIARFRQPGAAASRVEKFQAAHQEETPQESDFYYRG